MRERLTFLTAAFLVLAAGLRAQSAHPLRLEVTIPLGNVQGRIDHFSIDLKGERLFMSALGNNTVEVFNLRANQRLHTITGLDEPQGVTYAPDSNKIFIANAGDGTVRVFDGATYKLLSVVHFPSDADDTRYDAGTKHVYVGYGEGGIGAIDSATGKLLGEIKVEGHPEAFEVAKGGGKIYINIPTAREIAVADWQRRAVVARWRLDAYLENFPMALDAKEHRLFVVTRRPAQFLAFDTESGRMVARLGAVGDADDLWYDARHRWIYISGGAGFISVIAERDADHYQPLARIPTAPGARTSFYSPELNRLYLAVPHHGSRSAELRVYQVAP